MVGTAVGDEGNVISGNGYDGVQIISAGTDDNVVAGNKIGTDVTGTIAVANGSQGVEVDGGSADNTIGGSVSLPATSSRATTRTVFGSPATARMATLSRKIGSEQMSQGPLTWAMPIGAWNYKKLRTTRWVA